MHESDLVSDDGSAFRDVVHLIRRRIWLIVLPAVILGCAAALYVRSEERLYQGSAEVLISRDNPVVRLTRRPDPAANLQPDRTVQTLAGLARVPALAARVIDVSGLPNETTQAFLARSSVIARPNSDLLEFQVRDHRRRQAMRLTTAYARQFSAFRRDIYEQLLADQAAKLRRDIEKLRDGGKGDSLLAASLRERLRRVQTLAALQTSDALVVRTATNAAVVQPRPIRTIGLGVALGLFLGLALALAVESFDRRVRSAKEVGDRLGLPLLARIAKPGRLRPGRRVAMLADPEGSGAAPYRALRSNVDVALSARPARAVVVTSAVDSEGKSTTIANLAVAFARAGRRVLLVDLDFQRPMLATLFEIDGSSGISDVVSGSTSLDRAIIPVAVGPAVPRDGGPEGSQPRGSLGIVTAGSATLDAGELAGRGELHEALAVLRSRADLVLVDAPPLLSGGEAVAISAQVDAVVIVARLGVVRRGALDDVRRMLAATPAISLGYVLTGAERDEDYSARYYARSGSRRRMRIRQVA